MKSWFGLDAWSRLPGRQLAVAATVLVLGACGETGDSTATTGPPADMTTTTTSNTSTTTSTTTSNAPSTTTTSTTTPTTTVGQPGVVLESNGLGVVDLGSDPVAAVEAVQAVLGAPDEDSGWGSEMQNPLGYCGDEEWRLVRWGQLGVLLTDGFDDYAPKGGRHFAHYAYGGWLDVPPDEDPLRTSAGLAIGDSSDQVFELYGDQAVAFEGNEIFGPAINLQLGDLYPIVAWLDPDTSTVTGVQGGPGCGE